MFRPDKFYRDQNIELIARSRRRDRSRRAQGVARLGRVARLWPSGAGDRRAQPAARYSQRQSGRRALLAHPRRQRGVAAADGVGPARRRDRRGLHRAGIRRHRAGQGPRGRRGRTRHARDGARGDRGNLGILSGTACRGRHPHSSRRAGHQHRGRRRRRSPASASATAGICRPTSSWSASACCPMSNSRPRPACRSRRESSSTNNLLTSDPDISAIGDCALFASPRFGGSLRLESVQNATDHARCVAARLTGDAKTYDGLPWFWSDQGPDKLQIAGLTTGYDRVVVRGDPRAGIVLGVLLQVGTTGRHRIGQSRRRSHVRPPLARPESLDHAGAGGRSEFRFEGARWLKELVSHAHRLPPPSASTARRPSAARRSMPRRWRNSSASRIDCPCGQLCGDRADKTVAGAGGVDRLDRATRHDHRFAVDQRQHAALAERDADDPVRRLATTRAASMKRAGSSLSRSSVLASKAEFGLVEDQDIDEIEQLGAECDAQAPD